MSLTSGLFVFGDVQFYSRQSGVGWSAGWGKARLAVAVSCSVNHETLPRRDLDLCTPILIHRNASNLFSLLKQLAFLGANKTLL